MPARILVVEDSEEVRELMVLLLEADGFSVSSCTNAEDALAMMHREIPDLVLTDLMMGPTSGLDLITRIRSDFVPPMPPVVACSGFTEFAQRALERGAVAFIPKPFDRNALRRTVESVLARRQIAQEERDAADERASAMRARAVEAARAAVARLQPRWEDVHRRSQWTTSFVPRYFGFGEAFITLLRGNELTVTSSSNDRVWTRGQAIDLSLCRDIMTTASALAVPDLLALGSIARRPDGRSLRFFAGVPLTSDAIPVGTLCFVDTEPQIVDADEHAVLEAFGRRSSAVLSTEQDVGLTPMWTPSGLLTRDAFEVILAAELKRTAREPVSLTLLVYSGGAPIVGLVDHTAIAELAPERLALLIARRNHTVPDRVSRELVAAVGQMDGFAGGGLVDVEDRAGARFEATALLHAAEGLLESALRTSAVGARGGIDRIVIRRDSSALTGGHPATAHFGNLA